MEIRKVFKAGNSLVVSLPREVVKQLDLEEGMPLAVTTNPDKRQLVFQVVQLDAAGGAGSRYARLVEDFIDKYELVLKELG